MDKETTWTRRRLLGSMAAFGSGAAAAACGRPGRAASSTGGAGAVHKAALHEEGFFRQHPVDAELITRRYPGLKPFAPPPQPPPVKPVDVNVPEPPLIARVPTSQRVVFVTIDDGIEKDPAFIRMVGDFQVPMTLFLTDSIIKNDYEYFARLLDTGMVTIQNHTLTHPDMPLLSPAEQLEQVLGQQEKLTTEYGVRPYLFRPPYGNYDDATIAAVKDAGLKGVTVWKEYMAIHDLRYQGVCELHPGDVILSHFRGPSQLRGETMVGMMANLFRHVQQQGFTVARLTDYV